MIFAKILWGHWQRCKDDLEADDGFAAGDRHNGDVDVGTVDNQENVEPDNRKDPARFVFFRQVLQTFTAILMTALISTLMATLTLSRMTDLELKRRNRRESNQIQKTQEGMVSTYIKRSLTWWALFAKIFFLPNERLCYLWFFSGESQLHGAARREGGRQQLQHEEYDQGELFVCLFVCWRCTRSRWTFCLFLHLFLCLLRILKLW